VEKIFELNKRGKINLYIDSEVVSIDGKNDYLNSLLVKDKDGTEYNLKTDYWFPLFGLVPKLGPLGNWGLDIVKNAIRVDNTNDYSTNIKGVFAIGDINTYEGKLKLILCGFHEATLAVHGAYRIINPDKKKTLKYTTIQGVTGFD
jgi:thioredoxin reductase (NADPH)